MLASLSLLTAACGGDDDDAETSAETTAAAAATTAAPEASETSCRGCCRRRDHGARGRWGPRRLRPPPMVRSGTQSSPLHRRRARSSSTPSQALDNLNNLADRFKEEYGIYVEVVQPSTTTSTPSSRPSVTRTVPIADVMINATLAWQLEKSDEGWFTPVDLPAFDNPDYNSELNISEKATTSSANAAVLTYGWNTDLWPTGPHGLSRSPRPGAEGQDRRHRTDGGIDRGLLPLPGGEVRTRLRRGAGGAGAEDLPELAADG